MYVQYHHSKTQPLKNDKLIEVQRQILCNLTNSPRNRDSLIVTKSLLKPLLHQRMRIKMRRYILNEQNLVLRGKGRK